MKWKSQHLYRALSKNAPSHINSLITNSANAQALNVKLHFERVYMVICRTLCKGMSFIHSHHSHWLHFLRLLISSHHYNIDKTYLQGKCSQLQLAHHRFKQISAVYLKHFKFLAYLSIQLGTHWLNVVNISCVGVRGSSWEFGEGGGWLIDWFGVGSEVGISMQTK